MAEAFNIDEWQGLEWIEDQVTEWATDLVVDHFAVGSVDELSREELDEVVSQWQKLDKAPSHFHPLALGLRNVIRAWESEHDEEVL